MSGKIKNVAFVGASGSLGSVILAKLVASGKFNIKTLKRPGSKSRLPTGVDSVEVDFASFDALKASLEGQDAVVCVVGNDGIASQPLLVDAAASAGVKRFIPSEFGSNLDNPNARKLPVFAKKVQVREHLIETAKATGLTYTAVCNNAFLDWGIEHDAIISTTTSKPFLIDGGDLPFSVTTLGSIGDAVVGILSHPEETKNRTVYIHDIVTTQNKLLALAKQAAPDRKWDPVVVDLGKMVAGANERLAKGLLGLETFRPYQTQAVLEPGYGGKFDQTDNELLGVKGKTDQDVIEMFKKHLH